MKYNKKLIDAFINGDSAEYVSASVTSGFYFSYRTPIAKKLDNGAVLVDMTFYSMTTSRQRNELIRALESNGIEVVKTNDRIYI